MNAHHAVLDNTRIPGIGLWVTRLLLVLTVAASFISAQPVVAQTLDLTDTWTNIGGGQWQSTTANGVTVTASAVVIAPAAWQAVGTGQMSLDDVGVNVFPNADVYGRNSLQATYTWDTAPEPGGTDIDLPGDDKGTGTITFAFNEPVIDPIIYLDRVGGFGSGLSNSALLTLNGGLSWTDLASVGHFDVNPPVNAVQRTPKVGLVGEASVECTQANNAGTACGTVQISGTISSFSMSWTGVGVEGTGGDAFEIVLELPPFPADLEIIKTASPDPVLAGADLTYTLTVTNNGPRDATSVVVTDSLPGSVTWVSTTPSQGGCSAPSGVTCELGDIANGDNATVTIVVTTD
jgi:uncharacterized repeat protein (TIGR01451 family)